MSAILKFNFQKREQLRFSELNYLKTPQKRPNFACGNYIFPKTRGNKNKPWTHSTSLNNLKSACTFVWFTNQSVIDTWKRIIIIILRLRSRRLQDFSMHIDIGQVWRSGQPTYHLHHTQQTFDVRLVGGTWTSRSPFAMWWYIESISSDRLFFRETKDMPKKTQLSLPYKWFGVSHGIYDGVWNMVSPFNIEHNPVGWCGKSIDFAFHVLW